jgi:phosphatidylserine decarboxylase
MLKSVIVPIHSDGLKFIGLFAFVSLLLHFIWSPLGWIGWILTAWCIYFFRDPYRMVPQKEGLIVSPADGVVVGIKKGPAPHWMDVESDQMYYQISIFLNVFNVHVNRVPLAGEIEKLHYIPGKFVNASLDKASEDNERMAMLLKVSDDLKIGVVQIAGLIARRIRTDVYESQKVATGERYGLIRFGSRADVYFPDHILPLVLEGQTMIGGETILADLTSSETSLREGALI